MATLTLAQCLEAAQQAYHELLIGQAVAEFRDQNGESVRYSQANRAALAGYIADLKRQIDGNANSGPVSVWG